MIENLKIEDLKFDSNDRYGYAVVGGKMGVINSSYEWIIEPKYDYIKSVSQNAFKFKIEDKYGVIDLYGNIIIPPEYDFITGNPKSKADFFIVKSQSENNTPYFHLLTRDNYPLYHKYDFMWYGDNEHFLFLENNKFGIYGVDTDNVYREIIPAEYDDIQNYKDFIVIGKQYKEVVVNDDEASVDDVISYGLADYDNNVIIPLMYSEIRVSEDKVYEIPLKERTFFVNNNNRKSIIINSNNERICDKEFDAIKEDEKIGWGDFAYYMHIDKVPYIVNKFGNIIGCNNNNTYIKPFAELNRTESISLRTNNKCKEVINNNGDVLFSGDFETIDTNQNNLIFIKKDGKYGAVDRNNKIVIPFEEGTLWGRYDFVVRKNGNFWKPVNVKYES